MIGRYKPGDRRMELRRLWAGQVKWRIPGDAQTLIGWLSDTSPSSLSFVMQTSRQPLSGQEIEVIEPDQSTRRFRVTRTVPYSKNTSLVACRRLTPRNIVNRHSAPPVCCGMDLEDRGTMM